MPPILSIVGKSNSGKTTLVDVISVRRPPPLRVHILMPCDQSGQFQDDMIPTVGFNMKKVSRGNVTIKLWDIGGQPRFRSMWERYCRGVNAIVYAWQLPRSLE